MNINKMINHELIYDAVHDSMTKETSGSSDFERGYNAGLNVALQVINVAPGKFSEGAKETTAKTVNLEKWISVDVLLPPFNQNVLGYAPEHENIYIVYLKDNGEWGYSGYDDEITREEKIAYWMPTLRNPDTQPEKVESKEPTTVEAVAALLAKCKRYKSCVDCIKDNKLLQAFCKCGGSVFFDRLQEEISYECSDEAANAIETKVAEYMERQS